MQETEPTPSHSEVSAREATRSPEATGLRHAWPDRAFHWSMAASVLVLTISAFLPIVGIRFDWLPWHWVSGLVLTAAIVFHLVRVTWTWRFSEMLPNRFDLYEVADAIDNGSRARKAAKYDAFQKAYHWTTAIVLIAVAATGLVMLLKIDTPFWRRDPSILSDPQWGIVYVTHGVAALATVFLIIVHVYFTLLPEHRAMLKSMIAGHGPLLSRRMPHDRHDRP